jgi:hypothetical protein
MRSLLPFLLFSIAAAQCGTAVYDHKIEVSINDPSRRLGSAPIEVSIFDIHRGYSEEWARRTLGTTAPGAPYAGEVGGTATKMIYDRTPPTDLAAGLALPAFENRGYFVLRIGPVDGTEQSTMLDYTSYGVATADERAIPPLPARVRSTTARKGWTIRLTVDVPPAEPKP